ncbi:MAG: DUF4030 domain-containing protein [Heyndrickxia sp.]
MEDKKFQYPNNGSELEHIRFTDKNKQKVLQEIKITPLATASKKPKVNRSRKKKVIYSGFIAATLLIIFLTSAYVSPTMAKVAAKIPYFSLFIKQQEYKNEVLEVIDDVAAKYKYPFESLNISVHDKEISITILGTEKEVNNIKTNVIKNINDALIAKHFGKYQINVKSVKRREVHITKLSSEEKKNLKDSQKLEKTIVEELKKNNFVMPFPPQVRINKLEKYIYVSIPKTEKRMALLKDILNNASSKYGKFKYDIRKSDLHAREQENRWEKNNIIGIIVGGLMENKDFKVTGFSYSFHPLPLQIIIKTSVHSSDRNAKKLAKRIEDEINIYIKTDDTTKEVRHDPYIITVYSKDNKKIN